MYAAFTANTNYKTALMNDELHPNSAGYVVMASTWYAAISSYLSYSGPFEVLTDDAQVRFAKLEPDRLTLSTKPMVFQGVERRAELVWERVGHE